MRRTFGLFFLFLILVTGLIINPSAFPTSKNSLTSNDSELFFDLSNFAFAQEPSSNSTTSDVLTTTDTVTTSVNSTATEIEDTTEDETEDIHEQLVLFVEESRSLFEQQKTETRNAIKECQSSLIASDPSQRDTIRKQCRDNLNEIRESYKQTREIYKESFKEFRKSMDVAIRESKGLEVDDSERTAAISDIKSTLKSTSEEIKELRKSIYGELNEEKKQLLEQKREERKQMKEEKEAERESMKEEKEAERDAMKEQKQENDNP